MLKLGDLTLTRGRPVVACSFSEPVTPEALGRARSLGLDVAELRLDLARGTTPEALSTLAHGFAAVPRLATLRSADEGGQWSGSASERVAIYRAIVPHVDAVDVEIAAEGAREVLALAKAADRLTIASFHDFEKTPDAATLGEITTRGVTAGADIVKVACLAHGDDDVRVLARVLLDPSSPPLIVIAMGPHGAKSRVFFPSLGSRLTFAALEQSTAPGQLPLAEMTAELERFYPTVSTEQR